MGAADETNWEGLFDIWKKDLLGRHRKWACELANRFGNENVHKVIYCDMPLPTVVVDTNIFVAARFNPRSTSRKIMDAVKQGQVRMVWNDATRREIERILQQIPPLRTYSVADLFRPENCVLATTHPGRFSSISDPDDRKFAALAHTTGAILISNDEHLLGVRDNLDLTVLTPGEFWKHLQHPSKS